MISVYLRLEHFQRLLLGGGTHTLHLRTLLVSTPYAHTFPGNLRQILQRPIPRSDSVEQ